MPFHQTRGIWEKACLVITLCEWEYSSTPMTERKGMHHHPYKWKSIQASLVDHSHHNHSLSNTTREQSQNALSPNTSDLREGMSSHHSLWMRILFNSNDGALLNALRPIWMEVNSGKSSQSLTSQSITLKHNTRALIECPFTKLEGFERRHV